MTTLTFATVSYLTRPKAERRQAPKELVIVIGATAFDAITAEITAFAGVVIGRRVPAG